MNDTDQPERKQVQIYTDGSSRGNPGPGGYGSLLIFGQHQRELSGGFRKTTNNRMEILAAAVALEALKQPCLVTLYSDSKYLVDAMSKGWAAKWKRRGWRKGRKATKKSGPLKNPDLWRRLDAACSPHEITWTWVKGHAGDPHNERCDSLATRAAGQSDLPADEGYEDPWEPEQDLPQQPTLF